MSTPPPHSAHRVLVRTVLRVESMWSTHLAVVAALVGAVASCAIDTTSDPDTHVDADVDVAAMPTRQGRRPDDGAPPAEDGGSINEAAVREHLGDVHRLASVKAASLLLQHTQSCVDGRDLRPVVGTPGGDAGELVLALAALEHVRGHALTALEVERIFDAYLEAFGRFYMHTDTHALERLRHDTRLAPSLTGHSLLALEELVQSPPAELEGPLLEALLKPEHVGCGHLRLLLQHPEVYGVRPALTQAVLRLALLRLWDGGPIDFIVLEGGHHEQAVINVRLGRPVHAFTQIPTVSPHLIDETGAARQDHEVFVNHPEASAWLRSENAAFLVEVDPWLREDPQRLPLLLAELARLGEDHLRATLGFLAPELPVFDVVIGPDEAEVIEAGPPVPPRLGTLVDWSPDDDLICPAS